MYDDLVPIEDGLKDWYMLQSRNLVKHETEKAENSQRFYSFGELSDSEFIAKYYEYKHDSAHFKTDFKPVDIERAGNVMEQLLADRAVQLGVELETAKSVVATAIVKKQNELSQKMARSVHVDDIEKNMFEMLSSMDLVELDSIIFNVLYGCYLSKRTGRELMFELYNLSSTSCYILSKNGLKLMSLSMNCNIPPDERVGNITCTIGPGATRELAFNLSDGHDKLEGFDIESIFELCENCMDLSGKQIQDIFVKHLNGVKYECHDILDIESYLTGKGINLSDFIVRHVSEDQTHLEQSKETLCLISAESYIRNKWFESNITAGCNLSTCYDTGENSFNYTEWGKPDGVIRFGKAIKIAPFRKKHYADLTYPDIEFNFAIVGTVFELYVSGLTMRTNPVQGLEAILKIDYEKLIDEVSDVLGKVSMDRKNLDNLFDLELSL